MTKKNDKTKRERRDRKKQGKEGRKEDGQFSGERRRRRREGIEEIGGVRKRGRGNEGERKPDATIRSLLCRWFFFLLLQLLCGLRPLLFNLVFSEFLLFLPLLPLLHHIFPLPLPLHSLYFSSPFSFLLFPFLFFLLLQ